MMLARPSVESGLVVFGGSGGVFIEPFVKGGLEGIDVAARKFALIRTFRPNAVYGK